MSGLDRQRASRDREPEKPARERVEPVERASALQRAAGNQAAAAFAEGVTPLTPTARAMLERAYGVDLGRVRIHSDPAAAEDVRAERAAAFTRDGEVYLGDAVAGDERVLAHELAHVVQQTREPDTPSLSAGQLEQQAVLAPRAGGELSAAPAGATQRFDLFGLFRDEDEKKPPDPTVVKALVDEVSSDKEAWKRHLDDPARADILRTHSGIRHAYADDPDFKRWVKDPSFRPAGAVAAPTGTSGWTQEMEERRKAGAARAAEEEQPEVAAASQGPVTPLPSEVALSVAPPQTGPDWATEWNRLTPRQRGRAAYQQGTKPSQKAADARRSKPAWYFGREEQLNAELAHLPGAAMAAPGYELLFAESSIYSGRKASRVEAAKNLGKGVATTAVAVGSIAVGGEGLAVEGVAGETAPALEEGLGAELAEEEGAGALTKEGVADVETAEAGETKLGTGGDAAAEQETQQGAASSTKPAAGEPPSTNPRDYGWTARGPKSELPTVNAGHRTSRWWTDVTGEPEHLALEDATVNQTRTGSWLERRGMWLQKDAIEVDGAIIDRDTAMQYAETPEFPELTKDFVRKAPSHPGWTSPTGLSGKSAQDAFMREQMRVIAGNPDHRLRGLIELL